MTRGTLKNAFFILVGGDGTHLPHPRRSLYTPPVETPAPSAPGTAKQHRQQRRPCRVDRDGGGRWTACAVCPKLCRCGQHDFAIFYQKNKSEKSYIFIQKGLTYKIYLI